MSFLRALNFRCHVAGPAQSALYNLVSFLREGCQGEGRNEDGGTDKGNLGTR